MGIIFQYLFIYASLFTANIISQYVNKRPWPTYSLHNMPRTSFTCQDKILGGYYADPETQCQMFHVCVKVAGVGVQDFRFLCPNGTAFDQEAQICADWGDVGCEQATLYYSSDNFDLYRLGSGFESKRAPLAEEEESTFHLQRAESNDIRRSKQTVVDQHTREYKENFNYNTGKLLDSGFETKKSGVYSNTFDDSRKTLQKAPTTKKVSAPYIQVTSPSPTTTRLNNYHNEDELLKGSHSSNFFNNRNNGKDEDLVDFNNEPIKTQPTRTRQRGRNTQRRNFYNNNNILSSPSKPLTFSPSTTEGPRVIPEQKASTPDTTTKPQTLTLLTSFRTADLNQYNNQEQFRSATEVPSSTQPTLPYNLTPTKPQTQQKIQPTTYNPSNNGFKFKSTTSRYENADEAGKQFNNQKTQVNKNPFYNTQFENKATEYNFDNFNQAFVKKINPGRGSNSFSNTGAVNNTDNLRAYNGNDFNKEFNKSPVRNDRRRIDQYDNPQNVGDVQQNNYRSRQETKVNKGEEGRKPNSFGENQKPVDNSHLSVRPLDPQKLNSAFHNESNFNEGQDRLQNNAFNRRVTPEFNYQKLTTPSRSDVNYEQSISRGIPTPFTNPQPQNILQNTSPTPTFNDFTKQTSPFPSNQNAQQGSTPLTQTPRGFSRSTPFASKPSSEFVTTTRKPQTNNYDKYQTVSRQNENYTPPSAIKKFSTLVPKDQYYPTTFKPTTYKKPIDNISSKVEKPQTKFSTLNYYPSTTSTTTQRAIAELDEDDGQYHPELYEKDFPRNQYKPKQKVQSPVNEQSDFSDEDEFLKTAHSLNIAAGANQLRAEKAKQSSPNILFKSSTSTTSSSKKPSLPTSPPSSTRPKPKKTLPNEDTSYDYAYYDSNSGNPHDYAEYDVISEFGKTKRQ